MNVGIESSVEIVRTEDTIYALKPIIITTYSKLADMICTLKINTNKISQLIFDDMHTFKT